MPAGDSRQFTFGTAGEPELQVQAEWASLVAILYRTDSIHAEIIALYSALADALAAHNEAESVQLATRIIDTFTYYLIEKAEI